MLIIWTTKEQFPNELDPMRLDTIRALRIRLSFAPPSRWVTSALASNLRVCSWKSSRTSCWLKRVNEVYWNLVRSTSSDCWIQTRSAWSPSTAASWRATISLNWWSMCWTLSLCIARIPFKSASAASSSFWRCSRRCNSGKDGSTRRKKDRKEKDQSWTEKTVS